MAQDVADIKFDDNPNLTELSALEHIEKEDVKQNDVDIKAQESVDDKPVETTEQKSEGKEVNWEESAKYFQSEKDKLFAENEKVKQDLEQYKALGDFVKARPDIQEYLNGVVNGQPQNPEPVEEVNAPEDFDPWEAYNDPNSESYKFRQSMEQKNIEAAVAQRTAKFENEMAVKTKMAEFDKELTTQGLSEAEKQSFYDFANKPLDELGTDTLVNMWRAADQRVNTLDNASGRTEFDKIRQKQQEPSAVGVLQGEQPPKSDPTDDVWNNIMAASSRTKVI